MDKQYKLFLGRLGKNPELRYTPKHTPVCNFSLAINNGDEEETTWKRIVVWGKQAELCNLYLKTGSELFVQGQSQVRSYRDKDGNEQKIEEINARLVGFLSL